MKIIEINTESKVRKLIEELKNSQRIACDTESTGPLLVGKNFINVWSSSLTGLSLATPEQAYYLGVGHRVKNLRWDLVRKVLQCVSEHREVYFHNAKHDCITWTGYTDIPFPKNFRDTMLQAWLLGHGETYGGVGLKRLAKVLCGLEWGDFDSATKGRPAAQLTPKQLAPYAGMDAWATLQLAEATVLPDDLREVYENVELPFVHVLVDIERRGVALDHSKLLSLFERIAPEKIGLERWWADKVGGSINSPKQVAEALYGGQHWSFTGLKKGKSGQYPTDASAVDYQLTVCKPGSLGHEAALAKQRYSALNKIASTYTVALIQTAEQYHDKRLHPSYNQAGTATGRLSSSYPNAQNIPARSELAVDVMSSFVAGPGNYLFGADYSQIEYRICAHFAGGGLREAYLAGRDMHSLTAAALGVDRSTAKTVNFACLTYDHEVLTSKGFVAPDDVSVGDLVLGRTGWVRVLDKVHYDSAPTVEWQGFRCTPNHRWFSDRRTGRGPTRRIVEEFTTLEDATTEHRLWLSFGAPGGDSRVGARLAAIASLVVTDGHLTKNCASVSIFQSEKANPEKTREIDALLEGVPASRYVRKSGIVQWRLKAKWCREVGLRALCENFDEELILSLSKEARRAVVHYGLLAEGWKQSRWKFAQNPGKVCDAFRLAFFLEGYFVRTTRRYGYNGKPNDTLTLGKPYVTGQRLRYTVAGAAPVYCLRTEDETFTVRRGDRVATTGNTLYGAKESRIVKTLGCSYPEAKEILSGVTETYPEIFKYRDRVLQQAYDHGYSTSLLGRKRFFPKMLQRSATPLDAGKVFRTGSERAKKEMFDRWSDERKAFNMTFQGSAADICKLGMLKCYQAGIPMTAQIHDQVICEAQKPRCADLQECLEGATELTVPLVAEAVAGKNWKDLK